LKITSIFPGEDSFAESLIREHRVTLRLRSGFFSLVSEKKTSPSDGEGLGWLLLVTQQPQSGPFARLVKKKKKLLEY
jgi:hypothetical protein